MPITSIDDKSQIAQSRQPQEVRASYDQHQMKKEQNSAIINSQIEVSLKMGNEPMALLYKTALSAINEVLDPSQETKPIQEAYDNQVDTSPEATATRIVSLATGFYHAFQQQNPNMEAKESLDKFMSIITGGIDQGFKDARDILDNLSVLEGKIAKDIDSTYEQVQTGLKDFVDNFFSKEETINHKD